MLEKNRIIKLSVLGSLVFVLFTGVAVYANNVEGNNTQEKINALLKKLKVATQDELKNGSVIKTAKGEIFAGKSAEKMEKLHDDTQKQIDELIARPEQERQNAIVEIKKFAKDQKINVIYKNTSKASLNSSVPVEIYISGFDQYEVDIRNNKIIQFGPRPLAPGDNPKEFDQTLRYSLKELENMARQFILDNAPEVNLDNLTANFGSKENANYFFRWEDASREIEEMHPFIQVGFSRGGSLLSYANSLGL